jgi:cytochrome b
MNASRILVWDLPVRVFHWLLVFSFAGAFVTAESERYRDVHVVLGYTVGALIAFRLVWALVGSRYARLRSFAFGPRAVFDYVKSMLTLRPLHYTGHNPAGSWAVYALVLLGIGTVVAGHVLNGSEREWLEELHEGLANAMLALVAVHVLGVLVGSLLHRENLVRAMLTGYKRGPAGEGIRRLRWPTAIALASAVVLFWTGVVDVPGVPSLTSSATAHVPAAPSHRGKRHVEDDDD